MILTSRGAARALPLIIGALVVLNLLYLVIWLGFGHDYGYGFLPRLSIDQEDSVQTWYAATQLLAAAVLLAAIAGRKRRAGHPYARHWAALALIFGFLALDESIQIHEQFIHVGHAVLGELATGVLYWPWVIVGAAAVAVFVVAYARFLRALPARFRRLFVTAGAVYVGGAIGVELLNAAWIESTGHENLRYQLGTMTEEVAELGGIAIWLYALLAYVEACLPGLTLTIGPRPGVASGHGDAAAGRGAAAGVSLPRQMVGVLPGHRAEAEHVTPRAGR